MIESIFLVKGRLCTEYYKIVVIEVSVQETLKTLKITSDKPLGLVGRSVINKEKDLNMIEESVLYNNHRNIYFHSYCTKDKVDSIKLEIQSKIEDEFNSIKSEFNKLEVFIEKGLPQVKHK